MSFLLGLVIGLAFGGCVGVLVAGLCVSFARREANEIYQLRPKSGRDRDGRPAV